MALSLAGLGGVAAARGQAERAGRLCGAARRIFPPSAPFVSAASLVDLDQRMAAARAGLDGATFEAGWLAGQALSVEEAVSAAWED